MHQTRYDGSLLLYMSTIILSTSNGIALNPVAQHQTPPSQVEHVKNQFNICVFSLTTKRMTTASHTRLIWKKNLYTLYSLCHTWFKRGKLFLPSIDVILAYYDIPETSTMTFQQYGTSTFSKDTLICMSKNISYWDIV